MYLSCRFNSEDEKQYDVLYVKWEMLKEKGKSNKIRSSSRLGKF